VLAGRLCKIQYPDRHNYVDIQSLLQNLSVPLSDRPRNVQRYSVVGVRKYLVAHKGDSQSLNGNEIQQQSWQKFRILHQAHRDRRIQIEPRAYMNLA